jgi:hypothetical protein
LAIAISRLTPEVILIATGGLAASYLLRALRVYYEFRYDARGRFGVCLRIVLLHNALVNVIPFRGGEAAFPMLLRRAFGTPLPRAVASLFWFRVQDALTISVAAALVVPNLPIALRLALIVALIGFAWVLPRWARTPHDWAERGTLVGKLAPWRDAFGETAGRSRFGWLWTISSWSVKLYAQSFLLAALLATSLSQAAAGALGAEVAGVLPIQGVAGLGTYEATAAAALLPAGISFEDGMQAALVLHVFVIACALFAGALALLLPNAAQAHSADVLSSSPSESA